MTISFFDSFTPEDIARISAAGTRVSLPSGWSPIAEYTPADKAYIILEGEMSVRRRGEEIARLGAGDIVGETAIVHRSLRTASIVTLTRVELIHFTAEAVQALVAEMPAFAAAVGAVADDRDPVTA